MPKSKKKRQKVDNVQSLAKIHNLTGFQILGQEEESLAACLAEFQQETSVIQSDKDVGNDESNNNDHFTTPGSSSVEKLQDEQVDQDRVESWNRSVIAWVRSGNYTPGLFPSIDEELTRHFQVQELSKFLLQQGNDLRMPVFERWLLDSRLEDVKSKDPIFPMSLQPHHSLACQRLVKELLSHGLNPSKADEVVAELTRKTNLVGQELAANADRHFRTSPFKKGDRMDLEDHGMTVTLIYTRKKWKKPFCFSLNKSHYDKLQKQFFRIHSTCHTKLDDQSNKIIRAFHIVVVALMLRYSSMSGGQLLQDLRGGGMQGAVHEKVFEALKDTWDGPWIEGFASPLNAFLPAFGSAFSDLDWHFGSIGSFWETSFVRKNGCYCEANPPFSPGLMSKMVDHIHDQLDKADRVGTPLTFVIIVPTAGSGKDRVVQKAAADSFELMTGSLACRLHVRLPARDHGYIEGAQHLRSTRYKQSSYDTSVIVLQSKICRQMNFDEIQFEKKIRLAFASQHEQELKKRKHTASDC